MTPAKRKVPEARPDPSTPPRGSQPPGSAFWKEGTITRPTGHNRPRHRTGFTLTELVYVMIVVGVLAGVAIPLVDAARFNLNSTLMEAATELMAAQRTAVVRGHDVVVAIDERAGRIRIHLDTNSDGQIQTSEDWRVIELGKGVVFGRAGVPKLGQSDSPVTFAQRQGDFRAVTFHSDGSASEGGILYLNSPGAEVLPEGHRALEVIGGAAKIRCWSYGTGSWAEAC